MKILVVNGSPKGSNSNTMHLTGAVLEGIKSEIPDAEVTEYTIRDMDIKNCLGCMKCWGSSAGKCVIDDDMQKVHRDFMLADMVIYSFPLYFFGMPGPMKNFQDRMLPLMETYRGKVGAIGDKAFHEFRYDVSGKTFVLVSSCGYGSTNEIFDSLIKEFNFIFGTGNYTKLFCPQSEMFAIPPMASRIEDYLERYRKVGQCLAKGQEVPQELLDSLGEPILPDRAFEALVNRYWTNETPDQPLPAPHLR